MVIEFDPNKDSDGIVLNGKGNPVKKGDPSQSIEIKATGEVFCPNHGCALEGVPFPMPEKGIAMCPISGAMFEFESKIDPNLTVVLKDGSVVKKPYWEIKGDD